MRSMLDNGMMAVSNDGSHLFLSTPSGVRMFSLQTQGGTSPAIYASSGTPQSVTVGAHYANLDVVVEDGSGNPMSNAQVTFVACCRDASGGFANGLGDDYRHN